MVLPQSDDARIGPVGEPSMTARPSRAVCSEDLGSGVEHQAARCGSAHDCGCHHQRDLVHRHDTQLHLLSVVEDVDTGAHFGEGSLLDLEGTGGRSTASLLAIES